MISCLVIVATDRASFHIRQYNLACPNRNSPNVTPVTPLRDTCKLTKSHGAVRFTQFYGRYS
jgi:hypothetical protein